MLIQKIGITFIGYAHSKDWNNLHQIRSQSKDGNNIHRIRSESNDWNNLHQIRSQYLMKGIPETNRLTLSVSDEGYSGNQSFDCERI
jgi:hypothetical protein